VRTFASPGEEDDALTRRDEIKSQPYDECLRQGSISAVAFGDLILGISVVQNSQ